MKNIFCIWKFCSSDEDTGNPQKNLVFGTQVFKFTLELGEILLIIIKAAIKPVIWTKGILLGSSSRRPPEITIHYKKCLSEIPVLENSFPVDDICLSALGIEKHFKWNNLFKAFAILPRFPLFMYAMPTKPVDEPKLSHYVWP